MNWRLIEFLYFLFIWDHITIQPSSQEPAVTNQHVSKEFDWLISDRGPFHHSRSYLSFVERHRQGFTTRYKIYREFARWKVRNTAIDRRDLLRNPVPLMPEFQRSIRLLGRRPTTQQFIDTIIKKYGTHILISATLGGRSATVWYCVEDGLHHIPRVPKLKPLGRMQPSKVIYLAPVLNFRLRVSLLTYGLMRSSRWSLKVSLLSYSL
uniref:BMP/retinoic acid-inducible neural-specific protein 1 n=1 Tax=Anolis carolinensis TaxID=28377 RepID=L7N008_ANOCA